MLYGFGGIYQTALFKATHLKKRYILAITCLTSPKWDILAAVRGRHVLDIIPVRKLLTRRHPATDLNVCACMLKKTLKKMDVGPPPIRLEGV